MTHSYGAAQMQPLSLMICFDELVQPLHVLYPVLYISLDLI